MAAPTTYSREATNQPYLQPHPARTEEDFKASFDDLIDGYAAPYSTTATHNTYNIGVGGTTTHHRSSSIPFSKAAAFSSKHSDDTHETASSYAYPPVPNKEVDTRTFWQKILPESLACRLYVATVLVETTIDLVIEGELFLRVREKNKLDGSAESAISTNRMPVYLSIFALAHVFQFVMAVDAVYARNTLQFLCLTIFNALFLLYAIIQIKEIQEALTDTNVSGVSSIPINVLTTIIPVVISVAEIAYIGLGWKIYHEFGWKVYKFLGADRRIKKMYADYQIYECLVKFDVFFWAGFSVQFIWLVLQDTDWEYYVTCAALPLSIVLLVEGHLAARHENKWMMATFMSGCVGAMVYFIYKLIKVLLYKSTEQYKLIWKSLTVFSVIAIGLLFLTFIWSIVVLRNFNRGLKQALTRKAQGFGNPVHGRAASKTLNRMSIN